MVTNKIKVMRKYLLPFAFIIFFIENISAQEPVLNYKNFLGPLNSSFNLTSSKVVLLDTFKLLDGGQNLTWDFSRFGYITNNSLSKVTFSFFPKEDSWLIDSAENRWLWDNPEIDLVFQINNNRIINGMHGNKIQDIKEVYFKLEDTTIFPVGLGSMFTNSLDSKFGSFYNSVFLPIYFETTFFYNGNFIKTPISYGYNEIDPNIIDTFNVDTLGSNQTFWTIEVIQRKLKMDATGKLKMPFGDIDNCLRMADVNKLITKKINKQTGIETNDTSFIAYYHWFAPDIAHSVPVVSLELEGNKPVGGNWNITRLNSYITDQQSLAVLENSKTQIGNWFYPNPAKEEVIISDLENATNFKIFGLNGQLIKQNVLNSNRISVEGLPPNLYILEVENQTEKFRSKLIIH